MLKNLRILHVLLIGISLCLSLTITGCGLQDLLGKNKSKSTPKESEKQTIIAVSLNKEDPNKLLISKGIEDFAKKENVKVKYMDEESDSESSLKGAKILIYQGGDANILQKAEKEEIPILALTELPSGVKLEGIITPDQEKAGELMAQTLAGKVIEGQIVILQGDPNEIGSQERLAGNKVALSKYPKITIHTIASESDSESAMQIALREYLQQNPDKVQGILAHTETLAVQANEILKQNQLSNKISLVGGQASIASLDRMTSGGQIGDIDTSPYLQGVNAYQWAEKIIKKQPLEINDYITGEQGEIPAKIIQVKAVTPENLAITQKSYTQTMKSAEQDKKKKEEEDKKEGSSGEASEGDKKEQSAKEEDKGGAKKEEEGQSEAKEGAKPLPEGVDRVTERIKTETTREYLDKQGQVIGTEKTVNEQVKTVPPEMVKDQAGQSKDQGKDQGDQAKGEEKGEEKGGKEGSGK